MTFCRFLRELIEPIWAGESLLLGRKAACKILFPLANSAKRAKLCKAARLSKQAFFSQLGTLCEHLFDFLIFSIAQLVYASLNSPAYVHTCLFGARPPKMAQQEPIFNSLGDLVVSQMNPQWTAGIEAGLREIHTNFDTLPHDIRSKLFLDHFLTTDAQICLRGALPDLAVSL